MRYFIATYVNKPDGTYDEAVKVDKNLKNKDLAAANVIMDFKERKVLKLRLDNGQVGEKDWGRVWVYYHTHYKDLIDMLDKQYGYEEPKIEAEADPS